MGGGTKSIEAVCAGVVGGMVGILTHRHDRTGIPDIDNYRPLFDIPLPMIQHIVTLPNLERDNLLKLIYYEDTMGLHGELV